MMGLFDKIKKLFTVSEEQEEQKSGSIQVLSEDTHKEVKDTIYKSLNKDESVDTDIDNDREIVIGPLKFNVAETPQKMKGKDAAEEELIGDINMSACYMRDKERITKHSRRIPRSRSTWRKRK